MLKVDEVLDGGEGGGRVCCGGGGDRKRERYVAKDGEKGLLRGAGDMEKDDNLVVGSKVGGFKLEIVV